jgi:guanine deaminase
MATRGSARALGMADLIGRLAPGFKADLLFVDLAHVNYLPLNEPAPQLVFVENGAALEKVMVGGEIVVEGGRVLTVDLPALRAEVERVVERLRAQGEPARALTSALAPIVGQFCVGLAQEPYHVHRYVGPAARA